MHGQNRSEYKSRLLNPEVATKLATKARQWNTLSHELITQRRLLLRYPPCDDSSNNAIPMQVTTPGATPPTSPDKLLRLTEKMLTVNPDPSYLWNIRRELLLFSKTDSNEVSNEVSNEISNEISNEDLKEDLKEDESSDGRGSWDIETELRVTTGCLERNPKSYATWHHRKWSLARHLTHCPPIPEHGQALLHRELGLCAQFLQWDERNFHCWNYRRFVVSLLGCQLTAPSHRDGSWAHLLREWLAPAEGREEALPGGRQMDTSAVLMGAQLAGGSIHAGQITSPSDNTLKRGQLQRLIMDEWNFTSAKIRDNFSNGSAFHYRSKLLPLLLESRLSDEPSPANRTELDRYEVLLTLVRDEWESVLLDAIFTEPDDQTPWWYHRFLVAWSKPPAPLLEQSNEQPDQQWHLMVEDYQDFLLEMADSLRELIQVEKGMDMSGENQDTHRDESKGAKCKWAYLGMHLVMSTLLEFPNSDEAESWKEEADECLNELMRIDPNRIKRYLTLASG